MEFRIGTGIDAIQNKKKRRKTTHSIYECCCCCCVNSEKLQFHPKYTSFYSKTNDNRTKKTFIEQKYETEKKITTSKWIGFGMNKNGNLSIRHNIIFTLYSPHWLYCFSHISHISHRNAKDEHNRNRRTTSNT